MGSTHLAKKQRSNMDRDLEIPRFVECERLLEGTHLRCVEDKKRMHDLDTVMIMKKQCSAELEGPKLRH